MGTLSRIGRFYYTASHWPEYLAPLMDMGLRLYLAEVFFKSGLTKVQSWSSTLYLFGDVYDVPLLSPGVAATLATSAELGLSVLLAVGLLGRFSVAGLSILNVVAVISYADLSEAGLNQHICWGILLGVLLIASHGQWSVDAWFEKHLKASGKT